jgi:small subunit ribosomal protein S2
MRDITLKELLEAGCHFGHQTTRWNPKAASYIFGAREGVHIIDLAKTRAGLIAAAEYFKHLAKTNGTILIVGTKRQAQEVVKEMVGKVRENHTENSNFYYLLERWPGGLLTNFDVIKRNNLDTILRLRDDIAANRFVTKKEKLLGQRKLDRYLRLYEGLVGLSKAPSAVFLIDVKKDQIAVRECLATKIKILAITDTNVNPEPVEIGIPANDDAVGSVKIILDYLADAWLEGLSEREKNAADQAEQVAKEAEKAKVAEGLKEEPLS